MVSDCDLLRTLRQCAVESKAVVLCWKAADYSFLFGSDLLPRVKEFFSVKTNLGFLYVNDGDTA